MSRHELRPRKPQRVGALGERLQHVERRQRGGDRLQRRNRGRELGQQRVEQPPLAGERALLRRQRLRLERLELRRDVALGVLQRLAAPVVVGHALGVRARDLDVEAVHAVVFDLQVRDAAALALARSRSTQELRAVGVDGAQFVELGVEAGGDHAAVAQLRGRLGGDRAREQRVPLRIAARDRCAQSRSSGASSCAIGRASVGQQRQRVAQPGEVARARAAQRDARHDALDVDRPAQRCR